MRAGTYLAVTRAALADRLAARGEVFLGLASSLGRFLLALLLWDAVFDGRSELGGMSLPTMAGYYLVAVFVFQLDQSGTITLELAGEIRAGQFGKYLARPVDPLAWFLAASAGRSLFQTASTLLVAGPCACAAAGLIAPPSIMGILCAIPIILLGLLAFALVNFIAGILAFVFQDSGAFMVAKNVMADFLSGALIPIAFMPSWAGKALALTPFPALASLPASLTFGQAPPNGLPNALLVLALWNFALFFAARALLAVLSRRYEEVGA